MIKKNSLSQNLNVVAIQMNSTDDKKENFNQVLEIIKRTNKSHIDLMVLPEVFNFRSNALFQRDAAETCADETVDWLKKTALTYQMHIIGGSITEVGVKNKVYNTSFAISPNGNIIGTYRKMHLFDVKLDKTSIKESNHFLAGNKPEIIDIKGWKVGLSICYDLRFPELYRHYFYKEVDIMVVPSAFTSETGKKHWKILCQARAIENQCYMIAPNQYGTGSNNIKTYGHSLIIDPDGLILCEANAMDSMMIDASISKQKIDEVRSRIPTKKHLNKTFRR